MAFPVAPLAARSVGREWYYYHMEFRFSKGPTPSMMTLGAENPKTTTVFFYSADNNQPTVHTCPLFWVWSPGPTTKLGARKKVSMVRSSNGDTTHCTTPAASSWAPKSDDWLAGDITRSSEVVPILLALQSDMIGGATFSGTTMSAIWVDGCLYQLSPSKKGLNGRFLSYRAKTSRIIFVRSGRPPAGVKRTKVVAAISLDS
jgi:hypothetical protein